MKDNKFTFRYRKTERGLFVGFLEDAPNVLGQGKNLEELAESLKLSLVAMATSYIRDTGGSNNSILLEQYLEGQLVLS